MSHYRSVLVTALLVSATSAIGQISNGGFEAAPTIPPTPGDWQYNNGATRSSTVFKSGAFAAELLNSLPASNVNVLQQTPSGSVMPGVSYTLSYSAQAAYNIAGEGQLQIGFMNSSGGYLPGSPIFSQIPASASFVDYTRGLTAPAGASAFFIAFNSVTGAVPGSSSVLYIDDVSLVVVPEPASFASVALAATVLRRRR